MKPIELPPLPEPISYARWNENETGDFTDLQMRSYAASCVAAALEEAAKVCDEYPQRDPGEDGNGYWAANECAIAIRALNAETKNPPQP